MNYNNTPSSWPTWLRWIVSILVSAATAFGTTEVLSSCNVSNKTDSPGSPSATSVAVAPAAQTQNVYGSSPYRVNNDTVYIMLHPTTSSIAQDSEDY